VSFASVILPRRWPVARDDIANVARSKLKREVRDLHMASPVNNEAQNNKL